MQFMKIEPPLVSQNERRTKKRRLLAIGLGLLLLATLLFCSTILIHSYNSIRAELENSHSHVHLEHYDLERYWVSDSTAVCNDGSPSAYYVRHADPERWVVYFEGTQTWCHDQYSCSKRASQYIGSTEWEPTKHWGGIMSNITEENPHWHDASAVAIPSCSSDLYSGNAPASEEHSFHFLGHKIVSGVFNDLFEQHNISLAKEVAVAGNGGGGVAVLLHMDDLAQRFKDSGNDQTVVKGLPDTSILVDHETYAEMPCLEASNCALRDTLTMGYDLWNPILPTGCVEEGLTWECYVAEYSLHLVETEYLLFQYLYESAQLTSLGIPPGPPSNDEDTLAFAEEIALYYEDVILNQSVTNYFLPSCWGHELEMTDGWEVVKINDESLMEVFADLWDENIPKPLLYDDTCHSYNCNPTCIPR